MGKFGSAVMDPVRKLSSIDSRREQIANSSDLSLRRRLPRLPLFRQRRPLPLRYPRRYLRRHHRPLDLHHPPRQLQRLRPPPALPHAVQAETEIMRRVPDVILSDVIMPGKSGYELCRELKENPATRLIPFVLITGLSDREDRVRGIEAGADDFLSKPIFPEELFARVKSLIKLKEFTDELETAESVLCTLGLSVESRDPYTEGHCERLAENASNLGRHLDLDEDDVTALRRGGYLHDLGKIAVPDEILKKGANLNSQEWAVMRGW